MSEDDREYRPLKFKGKAVKAAIDRPRRATRRDQTYTESPVKVERDKETENQESAANTEEGAEKELVARRLSRREARAHSTESIWGGSERSDSLGCWSLGTFERRRKLELSFISLKRS